MICSNIAPFIAGIRAAFRTVGKVPAEMRNRRAERTFPWEGFEVVEFTPQGKIEARPIYDGRYELWAYSRHGWILQGTVHALQVDAAVKNLQRPIRTFPATVEKSDA
jgi:hypothetical protein